MHQAIIDSTHENRVSWRGTLSKHLGTLHTGMRIAVFILLGFCIDAWTGTRDVPMLPNSQLKCPCTSDRARCMGRRGSLAGSISHIRGGGGCCGGGCGSQADDSMHSGTMADRCVEWEPSSMPSDEEASEEVEDERPIDAVHLMVGTINHYN